MTTAREKLNVAFVNGAILLALIIGFGTGSFWVGVCGFGVLCALSTYSGDIRLKPARRKH
jgi:hypothetical protein